MIRNFSIKSALRNARTNSVLSLAKLFGISISYAVILFAATYVYYETSFDKCITDYNKIYRCVMQGELDGNKIDFAVTSAEMADAVLNEAPEIAEAVRIIFRGNGLMYYNDQTIEAGDLAFADPNFFDFFGFPIQKSLQNTFESENHIAIAKSVALQHFGSVEDALNKVVLLRRKNCVITGVFDDLPINFHLQTKIIQSIDEINPEQDGWGSQNYFTYIKTNVADVDINALSFKLTKTVHTHSGEGIVDAANAKSWDDLRYSYNSFMFFNAEPLTDIHFSKHRFDAAVTASETYVYGAIILALLILLISSFNFINLNIANLTTRFSEIGIRKSIGAGNNQIAYQFIIESLLFWIIGFILGLLFYKFGKTQLLQYLGLTINITDKAFVVLLLAVFSSLFIFNLASNMIPILIFSKKHTLGLIKNETTRKGKFSIKDSFLILQFVLSALIILSSLFVQKQINFMVNKDRGYDTQNVIMLYMWNMKISTRKTFIERIKTHTAIQSVSSSDVYFGDDPSMNGAWFETREDENYFHTTVLPIDDEFFNTFNIKLKEGKVFDKEKQSDFETALLNETAVREYRKSGSLIGKRLFVGDNTYNIIGIVKDFNFRSLYHQVQPLVITQIDNSGNVFIKIRNNQIAEALEIIREERKNLNLTKPLYYEFHNEHLANQYLKDQQAKKLLFILSLLSILIACVGLYAISFFTIIKRTKEIGIRKVNGAKITEVMAMLTKDFAIWVVSAFVIAAPIAYFTMNKWLQNFAFKTELSWWVFALAGLIALGIALLTVSWQTLRAARRNPVEALRYE
ncbi:MAG: hypothetical protein PF517_17230 [Salinivirgaceae bacterium]|jgi:putative ABC transport system permease protein|nr:hypothetical protein [Salinivirgaceae bacterium]